MLVLFMYDGGDDRDNNNNNNNISCTKVATIVHREVSRGCLVPAPMQGVLLLQNLHHLASRCVCERERVAVCLFECGCVSYVCLGFTVGAWGFGSMYMSVSRLPVCALLQ